MRMKKRYLILAMGTVLLLFLGLIYSYSVVMAPLKAQFGWSVSGMTLIFALSMIAFTGGNVLAGKLLRNHDVKFVFLVAIAFLLVGFVGSSFASGSSSLMLIYLTYGIIASVGIGLVYNVIVPTITSWFPDKTGLAQGVCLMGYGFGGFLLGPVITNVYAQLGSWQEVFVGVGIIFSVLVLIGAFAIRVPSAQEAGELPAAVASAGGTSSAPDIQTREATSAEARRDPVFWMLYLFLFLLGGIGMGLTGIGKEFPTSLGADAVTAAFVIGFVNIGSGIGRLAGGAILDKLGRAKTMLIIAALFLVGVCVMALSVVTRSIPVQIVGCLVCGISWGWTIITMPFVTRKAWGQKNFAENLAIVNSYGIFAAIVGSWGAGLLADALGSFMPVLAIMGCMAIAAFVVVLAMNRHVAAAGQAASGTAAHAA